MGRRNKVKYKYNPEQEDASERLMNEQSERERRIAILYLLYSVIKNYCVIRFFNLFEIKNKMIEAIPAMNTKNIKNSCKLEI